MRGDDGVLHGEELGVDYGDFGVGCCVRGDQGEDRGGHAGGGAGDGGGVEGVAAVVGVLAKSVRVAGGMSGRGLGERGFWGLRGAAAGFADGVVVGWTDFQLPAYSDVEGAAVWEKVRASDQGVLEEHSTDSLCDEGELGFGARAGEYRFSRV